MDTGNAVVDILNNPRYEGAMTTIRGVTDIVDTGFMAVITFFAFFIISVALLRNVLAGVYCAFPKFWDSVALAHEENKEKTFASMVTGMKDSYRNASMSTVKKALLSILPNIKVLTDFEDDNVRPKDYFIRAIPQMIGVVIIGVFIYNGYYRDATSLVAGTGAEFLQRTLLSFDPVEAFDKIANTAGRPSFATDNALDKGDKERNKITVDIYSNIITKYNDIKTADDKAILAAQIDAAVSKILNSETACGKILDREDYKITSKVEMAKDFNQNEYTHDGNPDQLQYSFKITIGHANPASPASDADILFDYVGGAYEEDWYIRVLVLGQRQATQVSTNNRIDGGTLVVGTKDSPVSYPFSGTQPRISGTVTDAAGNVFTIKAAYNTGNRSLDIWAEDPNGANNFEGPATGAVTLEIIPTAGTTVSINVTEVSKGTSPRLTIGSSPAWELPSSGALNLQKKTQSGSEGSNTSDTTSTDDNSGVGTPQTSTVTNP